MVDVQRSRRLAATIGAGNRNCYNNAITALFAAIDTEAGAVYVEGHVSVLGLVFGHGWIELQDGTILDPTPTYCHEHAGKCRYFPALRYTLPDIADAVDDQGGTWLPLVGPVGIAENEHYRRAYAEAVRATFAPDVAEGYLRPLAAL